MYVHTWSAIFVPSWPDIPRRCFREIVQFVTPTPGYRAHNVSTALDLWSHSLGNTSSEAHLANSSFRNQKLTWQTARSEAHLANSSFRSRTSSSAVHWSDSAVNPQMSANIILKQRQDRAGHGTAPSVISRSVVKLGPAQRVRRGRNLSAHLTLSWRWM